MSGNETIERIAARGDGVTGSGRHIAYAAPGDVIAPDGTITPGPHHVPPPCRHFRRCGGCQLQHCDEAALAQFVTDRPVHAAASQGLKSRHVMPAHISPPGSRRRATLHAERRGKRVDIGFREGRSRRLIDIAECPVLDSGLFALLAPLRKLLAGWNERLAVDIELVRLDQGIAVDLRNLPLEGLAAIEAVGDFARAHSLARLSIDQGYGPETQWEPEPATITLAGVPVACPPGAFLQATGDGEAALRAAAADWLGDCGKVADLFAGLGTFAFELAGRGVAISAFEAAREAHLACRAAAQARRLPVSAYHRDLFRAPLQPDELDGFDAVLLDPPRAGAREQVAAIAQSAVRRIVYISCNPQSWARDAAMLTDAGYRLSELRPVGQFRWSTHIELASLFERVD